MSAAETRHGALYPDARSVNGLFDHIANVSKMVGTLAVPAPSQPLAMAVDPDSSLVGLELPSSLLNRIAGLRTANTTLDVQLCALVGWWHI